MSTMLSNNVTRDGLMIPHERHTDASSSAGLMDAVIGDLVDWFKLLADETRLRIVHFLLNEKELNVRTLCGKLGQSQPAVSHHLALLKSAGMIECRRDGKHNYYHLMPQRFNEINDLLTRMAPSGVMHMDLPTTPTTPTPIVDAGQSHV